MAYRVRTESFEGPFDLLLSLVSRQKVDIGALSLSDIVDQYLAEVRTMGALDLDVASDFLLVAATLLEIKAQSLLPRDDDEVASDLEELSTSEAREWLVEQLLAYKQYKNAAAGLEALLDQERRCHGRPFGPDAEYLQVMPDFLEGMTVEGLASLAAGAFARREVFLLESEHIAAKPLPVEAHVRAIYDRIRRSKRLRFSDLVTRSTPVPVTVVTFLAILELYKRSMVTLAQDEAFGDIAIAFVEGSGALLLEGDDALTSLGEETHV
ncbi:segregation/condensation protein A [Eggerthellaceae bacterium zg-887]|uniref:segregation and condensation protein A n=1 Tax=Xiamenia xianingshaonis TaxID=2682776 RepID=UPI0014076A48|nr:ScpA family protein [Xiamenia xianingshaonis]NHM16006.1 segregation/condensation protein A [Xiamenia xianingshaonis]